MKITSEFFEITPNESIAWQDVKTMRMLNNKLAFVLSSGRVVEVPHLRPSTIDQVFRTYETYLREHPKKHARG